MKICSRSRLSSACHAAASGRRRVLCLPRRRSPRRPKAGHLSAAPQPAAKADPPIHASGSVEPTARRDSRLTIHAPPTSDLRPLTSGFTLVELLIVTGIIAMLMVLVIPAFTNIKSGSDVTSAAYTIKGVLDTARTYAKANNTYSWVGFFEENIASTTPGTAGIGRLVMSIVASKDGTMMYTAPLTTLVTLAPANLIQVGKLAKIDNLHLKTFPAPTATPPPDTFDTRPAVSSTSAQIGDTTPPSPSLRFQYPLGGTAQYTFTKAIQFSPRGEGVIDNSNYTLTPVSEIGVQASHGTALAVTVDPVTGKYLGNLVAVQFTGVGGNVKIYRR